MATAISGFDAAAVREGFRLPMRMALPNDPERRPEFVREEIPAGAGIDDDGIPLDPTQEVDPVEPIRSRVLCAIEWLRPGQEEQNFTTTSPAALRITLLDEEYEQVEGFDYVNIWASATDDKPVRFYFRRIFQQVNLDTVGVWTIEVSTEDAQ